MSNLYTDLIDSLHCKIKSHELTDRSKASLTSNMNMGKHYKSVIQCIAGRKMLNSDFCSQLACQLSQQSIAVVFQRPQVQILYRPEFLSGLIFHLPLLMQSPLLQRVPSYLFISVVHTHHFHFFTVIHTSCCASKMYERCLLTIAAPTAIPAKPICNDLQYISQILIFPQQYQQSPSAMNYNT